MVKNSVWLRIGTYHRRSTPKSIGKGYSRFKSNEHKGHLQDAKVMTNGKFAM